MNNFERITASPEALGAFLASLPLLQGPWDDAFHRTFCDTCRVDAASAPMPRRSSASSRASSV